MRVIRALFRSLFAGWVVAPVVLVSFLALGCSDDDGDTEESPYLAPTSTANVLYNFQVAYREQDSEAYAGLLADDFRFYFDPVTRDQLGIESWTKSEDALQTGGLFDAPEVTKIVIELNYPTDDQPATGAGRESWRLRRVTDVYLDVDFAPAGQPETTFRVENQPQDFYFRQGRSAADTLASSPTADDWYLVEWRDHGTSRAVLDRLPVLSKESSTWSSLKALIRGN